jgi:hypothetical protein
VKDLSKGQRPKRNIGGGTYHRSGKGNFFFLFAKWPGKESTDLPSPRHHLPKEFAEKKTEVGSSSSSPPSSEMNNALRAPKWTMHAAYITAASPDAAGALSRSGTCHFTFLATTPTLCFKISQILIFFNSNHLVLVKPLQTGFHENKPVFYGFVNRSSIVYF